MNGDKRVKLLNTVNGNQPLLNADYTPFNSPPLKTCSLPCYLSTHVQYLQKILTLLDFFHILLCYSLNVKCITFRSVFTGLNTIPYNVKVFFFCVFFYKFTKNEKLKSIESISTQPLCYSKPK